MFFDQQSLAKYAYIALRALCVYLYRHARAEINLRPTTTPAVITFMKIYRPGTVLLSIMLSCLVLHLSSVSMIITMVWSSSDASLVKSCDNIEDGAKDLDHASRTSIKADRDPAEEPTPKAPSVTIGSLLTISVLRRVTSRRLVYHTLLWITVLGVDHALELQSMALRAMLFILTSTAISPLRMLWTHSIISRLDTNPASRTVHEAWRRDKLLWIPALAYSGTQALTFTTPIIMIFNLSQSSLHWDLTSVMHVLSVPATAVALVVSVLLPTAIALARVEAALLPADQETIVPIDRTIVTSRDLSCGAYFRPFIRALRSYDLQTLRRVSKQDGRWTILFVLATSIHKW